MIIINDAYNEAKKVLKKCVTPDGLHASGSPDGYRAVWSRDAVISLLGGSLVGNEFKGVFARSLETLAKNQSVNGQIPNCVGDFNVDRNSIVTFTTVDSSLWFIIGEFIYAKTYKDRKLFLKHKKSIRRALTWIQYQDTGEDHLPEQLPTSDWQDAFPHKYGHVINTQALYYQALKILGQKKEADIVKKIVNGQARKDLNMFDKKQGFYLPWVWKNHDGDREQEDWFDSLGNLLAIVTELAEPKQANGILNYIESKGVNEPFPIKCIFPPLGTNDPEWHSYFEKCEAREPFKYANGGIWPFIGGFYVAALVKAKRMSKAREELGSLARANKLALKGEWAFNEWLDGVEGKPAGSIYQAWSAGMYIYAYKCVQAKKVLFF
ncbi:hypothetical protein KKD19_02680 [Patescibacteria group bacterium]|nr:hypothetical protein [Patescibacteria group bacterium]MBU4512125.1 hypothetical protein [Patescibacteria group bacterium]MCG2692518.1 hypothetical protein [Candidatus Parcubacteria bacterium]